MPRFWPLAFFFFASRSQLSLREKHAKHLADLRAYYEAELKDLREKLSLVTDGQRIFATSTQMESVEERILREENHTLRQHCQDLQDVLDDANMWGWKWDLF